MDFNFDNLKSVTPLSYDNFAATINEIENLSIESASKLIESTIKQCAYWKISYLFSPKSSPDIEAKKQWESYEVLTDKLIKLVSQKAPKTEPIFVQIKEMLPMKFISEWNIEYYKSKPIKKLLSDSIGSTAYVFSKIGLKNLASKLMWITSFPVWTVGRNRR